MRLPRHPLFQPAEICFAVRKASDGGEVAGVQSVHLKVRRAKVMRADSRS